MLRPLYPALVLLLACAAVARAGTVADSAALTIDDAVHETVSRNAAVRAAQAQYQAATHQIDQAYTPADPQLSIQKSQTPNALTHAQTQSVGISESFQFPGKGLLQGSEARRTAEISRLTYMAAVRDATAQARTAYYQTVLDSASVTINRENAAAVAQVLEVARIAYTANQGAQTDLISAQFALSQASQAVLTSEVAEANDEVALNAVMLRRPGTPLLLASGMDLAPLAFSPDEASRRALAARQELLEAALSEKNANTALKLAWMELLPDYNVSWTRNLYPSGSINSVQPINPKDQTGEAWHDFSGGITFNVPIFAWFHQKEDIRAASALLDSARAGREGVEIQTLSSVAQLYRSTQLAYQAALLYRDVLSPLAAQNLRVGLISYQNKKIDFTTLANILQSLYSARVTYLTSANQFLAGRVALEQAMGGPLAP